jgi:protein required for attachment to host cells
MTTTREKSPSPGRKSRKSTGKNPGELFPGHTSWKAQLSKKAALEKKVVMSLTDSGRFKQLVTTYDAGRPADMLHIVLVRQ